MVVPPRTHPLRYALAATILGAAVVLGLLAIRPAPSAADSLGRLNSQLGAQQTRQSTLSSSIGTLNATIGSLSRQIALVQGREATVSAQLTRERTELAQVKRSLADERIRLTALRRRLSGARRLLADQLRSRYESTRPDLMTVVLDANGFQDLLNQLDFLGRAEHEQQTIIHFTRTARAQAAAAAVRLSGLQRTDAQLAHASAVRARALAGMNVLLNSRQGALSRARTAQSLALGASRAASRRLRTKISSVKAQRVAAARAAAAALAAQRAADAAPAAPAAPAGPAAPTSLGPTTGWVIPYAIVLCESGGQNLPPNGAGASGYYQIIPSTWRLFGGTGPAAYLAPRAEQDAVASRIWRGGAGASNWVCAGIVGIH